MGYRYFSNYAFMGLSDNMNKNYETIKVPH